MVSQITSTSTAAFFTLKSQKTSRFISGFPSWRTSNTEFRLSKMSVWKRGSPSQWGHNGLDGVSNQGSLDCLLSRLFRRWSKNTPKPHVTGLCDGNPLLTGGFPPQKTNNAENVSSWWRHHARCLSWRHHDTRMLFFLQDWSKENGTNKTSETTSDFKTRFRCAMSKSPYIEEVKDQNYKQKGEIPYKVFKILEQPSR